MEFLLVGRGPNSTNTRTTEHALYLFFFLWTKLHVRDQLYWANTTDLRPVAGLGSVPLIFTVPGKFA